MYANKLSTKAELHHLTLTLTNVKSAVNCRKLYLNPEIDSAFDVKLQRRNDVSNHRWKAKSFVGIDSNILVEFLHANPQFLKGLSRVNHLRRLDYTYLKLHMYMHLDSKVVI